MMLNESEIRRWCTNVLKSSEGFPALEDCLNALPSLDEWDDLPAGTRVIFRCDLNVPLEKSGRVADDARLVSLVESLKLGLGRGWVVVALGHSGTHRYPSLRPVASHLGWILSTHLDRACPTSFHAEWLDDRSGVIRDAVAEDLRALAPGSLAVLENSRGYNIEQCLWDTTPADLSRNAARLARFANDARDKLGRYYVHEAFAASNPDVTSILLPVAMDRVSLGIHSRRELRRLAEGPRQAELVVFSGAKLRKIDDLIAVLRRRRVHWVLIAGFLALPFLRAAAARRGETFEIGLAGIPGGAHEEFHVSDDWVTRAGEALEFAEAGGVEVVLPVDFRLDDGTSADRIPDRGVQYDLGPKSLRHFAAALEEFARYHAEKMREGCGPAIVFHNGVFGVFERAEFAEGTCWFVHELMRLHEQGVDVYVGGGEGGMALRRFGEECRVTHCFTAGVTVLKGLGSEPIPYVKALLMASTSSLDDDRFRRLEAEVS